jgi:hypothetical protein
MESLSSGKILDNTEDSHDMDCWVDEMLRCCELIQPLDDLKTRMKEYVMAFLVTCGLIRNSKGQASDTPFDLKRL